jgi:hypothetical protein
VPLPRSERARVGPVAVCDICTKTFAETHLARHKNKKHGVPLPRSERARVGPGARHKKRKHGTADGIDISSAPQETPSIGNNILMNDAALEPLFHRENTLASSSKRAAEVALVDTAISEIESFLKRGRGIPANKKLRSSYECILPVLKDNKRGAWKVLDALETLHTSPQGSKVRVLETSNSKLKEYLSHNILPSDVGCIVIRADLPMPDLHHRSFQKKLATFGTQDRLEGQQYGHESHTPTTSHGLLEHLLRHKHRAEDEDLRMIGDGKDTPRNILSLSGRLGAHVPPPVSLQILGYDLLEILTLNIRAHYQRRIDANSHIAGKEHSDILWLSDLASCLRFCLFGDRLSISLSHLDVLNGTWVTCLSGYKMWFIYDGAWGPKEQEEFKKAGEHWMPVGHFKLVLLRPGDTFIMRPGHAIVHAVLTLDDSVMVGGMVWPEQGLQALSNCLEYIAKSKDTTNEYVPKQLPEYIDAIIRLGNDQSEHLGLDALRLDITADDVAAMHALKEKLLPLLACQCKGQVCDAKCPCREGNQTRIAGCTTWCHPNYEGIKQPSARCKVACNCKKGCKTMQCICKQEAVSCSDMCHPNAQAQGACRNILS